MCLLKLGRHALCWTYYRWKSNAISILAFSIIAITLLWKWLINILTMFARIFGGLIAANELMIDSDWNVICSFFFWLDISEKLCQNECAV